MQGCEAQELKAALPIGGDVRQVLDDVEDYLGGWVARLQRVLDQCHTAASREAELLRRMTAFDQQCQQWQTQRQHEMQQIHQGAEQLAAAWQRLESEQRQWLSLRRSSHQGTLTAARAVEQTFEQTAGPGAGNAPPERAHPATHQTSPAALAAPQSKDPSEATSRELAVRQFEQLRREVGQYSRSHR